MKKTISIFLFILSTTLSFAQVNFGVKGGANYAYFPDIKDGTLFDITTEPILAYHAGFMSEISLVKNFAVTAEALFSVKGSKVDQSSLGDQVVSKFSTSYISVPIAAKLKLGKLGKFGILGGIEPSFLVSERVKLNDNSWESAEDLSNNFDFSLIGGVDFKFTKLYLGLRYIHGLSSALDVTFTDQNGQSFDDGKNQNRVIQLSAGYFFL